MVDLKRPRLVQAGQALVNLEEEQGKERERERGKKGHKNSRSPFKKSRVEKKCQSVFVAVIQTGLRKCVRDNQRKGTLYICIKY